MIDDADVIMPLYTIFLHFHFSLMLCYAAMPLPPADAGFMPCHYADSRLP